MVCDDGDDGGEGGGGGDDDGNALYTHIAQPSRAQQLLLLHYRHRRANRGARWRVTDARAAVKMLGEGGLCGAAAAAAAS